MGMVFIEDLFLKFKITAISWFWNFRLQIISHHSSFKLECHKHQSEHLLYLYLFIVGFGMLTLPVSNSPREDDYLIIRGSL